MSIKIKYMLRAIKVRIYPTEDQQVYLANQFGCCRKVYNTLLAYRKSEYENNKHTVSDKEISQYLTKLKDELPYLKDVHSKVLQQSMRDLNSAFTNFFRGLKKKQNVSYPDFKKKYTSDMSCRFPSDIFNRTGYVCDKIRGNRITLIKQLSNILFACSTKDEVYLNKNQKYIRSITLYKQKSGIYTLSILINKDIKKYEKLDTVIGIDLGIKDFAVDSNGYKYPNLHFYINTEKKIKHLHKQLSKKEKDSKNHNKARIKLAKFYEKITNKKLDYLHKLTSKLVRENQVICIEDLNVNGMLKNRKLAKSIQELSLYEFRRQLTYKCEQYGRNLVVIDRWYPSSKTCHECGHKNSELTLEEREWICPNCGHKINRDYNAALNILDEGLRIFNG